ncbi:hypothetical protein C8N47_11180 [Mangrovibacterium marinum]|uniref:Uncharacterized protein n=1 Tax=Mangrovibacterium marinum TaxID=1639118 RepID=A0A2T5C0E5_9BACT|nr:hypothetical protein [Mangrovibacterium marinum]PTN08040.1 hypothetical protein C8N47_11180 [Mangrovibacterium marinum]
MAQQVRTTFNYRESEYPFYKTNRGNWDFEAAGFSGKGITEGKNRDLIALAYFHLRDCAKRANMPFNDSLDEFIDNSDDEVNEAFARLYKLQLEADQKEAIPVDVNGVEEGGKKHKPE